jgi:hypothetical protein
VHTNKVASPSSGPSAALALLAGVHVYCVPQEARDGPCIGVYCRPLIVLALIINRSPYFTHLSLYQLISLGPGLVSTIRFEPQCAYFTMIVFSQYLCRW